MAILVIAVSASIVGLAESVKSPPGRKKAVPSSGSVSALGIELYWDRATKETVSSVDWGTLEPGSSRSVTIYVKNEGKDPVQLSYYTSNWNPPEATNYLNLGWDYNGQALKARKTSQLTFTLSVAANATGIEAFSFDLTVMGNE